ncbi:hypothetical protein [Candidatus Binatus sp.]|uniref:hypothetical protein n=1 Tax=Candidatus Binatus sp. TaxID=2811406 RepID=UPI003C7073D1
MDKRTTGIISGVFLSATIFYPRAAHAIPVGELMKMPISKQAVIVVDRIQDVKDALRSEKIRNGTLKSPDRIEHDKKVAECVFDVFDPLPNSAYQTGMRDFDGSLIATEHNNPSVDLDSVLVSFIVQVCGTGKLVPPKLR